LFTTAVHNTAQKIYDNFPSYPPDSRHSANEVHVGEGTETDEVR